MDSGTIHNSDSGIIVLRRSGLKIYRIIVEDNSGEIIILVKGLDYYLGKVTFMWWNPRCTSRNYAND